MQEEPSRRRILTVLLHAGRPLSLQEVAAEVPLSPSTVLRHLQTLAEDGWVERSGHRKEAAYRPRPRLEVSWVAEEQGAFRSMAWRSQQPVDWRFPLVSRVPDAAAQASVRRFLATALAGGLLTPWLLPRPAWKDPSASDPEERKRVIRHDHWLHQLKNPREPQGLAFVLYGSSARDDARADSDVDLLVLGPAEGSYHWMHFVAEVGFSELAAELNLGLERPLQVMEYPLNELQEDHLAVLRQEVLRDGLLVYHTKPFVTSVEGLLGA